MRNLLRKYGSGIKRGDWWITWTRKKDGQEFRTVELMCYDWLGLTHTDLIIKASRIDELIAEAESADL